MGSNRPRTGRRGAAAALVFAAALVAGACGSDAETPAGTATAVSGPGARAATARSVVPAVDVVDVATGRTVGLRDRVATDRPSLLWLWAPS